MQVKKRGISLKQLTEHSPGVEELSDDQPPLPPATLEVDELPCDLLADLSGELPDGLFEGLSIALPLDDIVLEVLEDLEDTLELLTFEPGDTGPAKGT